MTREAHIELLLSRCVELRHQGQPICLAEVCADCPELATELASRLDALEHMDIFLDTLEGRASGQGAEPTTVEVPAPKDAGPPGERFSFFDPPRGPGELGWLGDYKILGVLGQGGMGVVFRAEEQQPRRLVALKVMKPHILDSDSARQRFLREGQALAEVQHDRVIPIFRVGKANGVLFLAMPLLRGESLQARLAKQPPLTLREAVGIGRGIAEGLAAIHEAGLVHRDIKPGNVFLPESTNEAASTVKILDFGLARSEIQAEELTAPGAVMGTAAYMAPEQAGGQPVDARADLFSLGCVLYRLGVGTMPFSGPTLMALLQQLAIHQPTAPHLLNPHVPEILSKLIMRLLAKNPGERPESARVVARELRQIEESMAITAPHSSPPPLPAVPEAPRQPMDMEVRSHADGTTMAWVTRNWVRFAVVLGGGGLLALAMWGAFLLSHQPPGSVPLDAPLPKPQGQVTLVIWRTEGDVTQRLRLNEAGALPLRPGDQYRIKATLAPKNYAYLFWIDTEGKVSPLYPWQPGKWGARPAQEEPVAEVGLPTKEDKAYKIKGDKEGMETVLLLVSHNPLLLSDQDLQERFTGLGAQRPLQNPLSAAWYDNGKLVHTDPQRTRQAFDETDVNDPVLRLQAVVWERLQPFALLTSTVSFARMGK